MTHRCHRHTRPSSAESRGKLRLRVGAPAEPFSISFYFFQRDALRHDRREVGSAGKRAHVPIRLDDEVRRTDFRVPTAGLAGRSRRITIEITPQNLPEIGHHRPLPRDAKYRPGRGY